MATTWRHLLAETTAAIGDRNHARWMCAAASGFDGGELLTELDRPATQRMMAHLDAMIVRRLAGEPLQYVLGRWQFRNLELMVDRRVLIPRPETEWMCQVALDVARARAEAHARAHASPPRPLRIVDLGTGSGAIGLSLAAELPVGTREIWLTDVSADALDVARANLAGLGRAGSSVRIAQGSWFDALPGELRGCIDVAVANPPYIAHADPAVERAVLDWEPHVALFGGEDGLRDITTIVRDSPDWLVGSGSLVIEIGAGQGAVVGELLTRAGFRHVEIRKDLAGHDRTAVAGRPA